MDSESLMFLIYLYLFLLIIFQYTSFVFISIIFQDIHKSINITKNLLSINSNSIPYDILLISLYYILDIIISIFFVSSISVFSLIIHDFVIPLFLIYYVIYCNWVLLYTLIRNHNYPNLKLFPKLLLNRWITTKKRIKTIISITHKTLVTIIKLNKQDWNKDIIIKCSNQYRTQ